MGNGRLLTGGLYLAALLCFLLAFFTVSCQGERVVSLTGVDLVVGKTIERKAPFGPSQKTRVEREPLAAVAALQAARAAIAGAGAGLLRACVTASAGVAAVVTLFLLKARIVDEVARHEMGEMMNVTPETGYWLTALALVGGTILAARTAIVAVRSAGLPASAAQPSSGPSM
ncbi:MAG: hypothetical protein RBU36_11155 [Thermoanaerobaculia bacterium]|jgi:hypothetical protein|nr:hypothetical protein [Thermoanaerobaculia bacterium]